MKKLLFFILFFVSQLTAIAQDTKIEPSNILTGNQKIYGLSKFWQEARENFIFINQIGIEKWDSIYQSFIPLVTTTKNDWEYFKLLQRFCTQLNDGHTYIMRPPTKLDQTEPNKPNEVFLPERDGRFKEGLLIILEQYGKIVVVRVNKNLGVKIPIGSQIHTVNNLPIEEYINRYTLPYVSQSADHTRRIIAVRNIVNGCYGDSLRLGYTTPEGKENEIKLTFGSTSSEYPDGIDSLFPTDYPKDLIDIEWHENDIAHLKLNSFANHKIVDDFKNILPELRKAKGLIIDLRFNGGGNSEYGVDILQYLTPDDILYGAHSRSRMIVPSYKAWGNYTSVKDTIGNELAKKSYLAAHNKLYQDFGIDTHNVGIDRNDRLIVPTVILTNVGTASAAEDFLIYADNQKHMIRMGQKTYGSTGQPILVSLVGGISAAICTKEDTYPDGRKFVGVGVIPHIEVNPTWDDYMNNKDPEVDKAIEYLKKQPSKKQK